MALVPRDAAVFDKRRLNLPGVGNRDRRPVVRVGFCGEPIVVEAGIFGVRAEEPFAIKAGGFGRPKRGRFLGREPFGGRSSNACGHSCCVDQKLAARSQRALPGVREPRGSLRDSVNAFQTRTGPDQA